MQIEKLKTFIKLVQTGSYQKTAKALFISQPAVSQQIRSLENEIGFSLVDHHQKNNIVLTDAGIHFYKDVTRIVQDYENCLNSCRQLFLKDTAKIHIGLDFRDSNIFSPAVYKAFNQAYPRVKIQISLTSWNLLMDMLYDNEVDAIYGNLPEHLKKGFDYCPLTEEQFAIATSPASPLAKKKVVNAEDLLKKTLVLPDKSMGSYISGLKEKIQKKYPQLHISDESYIDITYPLVMNTNKVLLTIQSAAEYLRDIAIIPLSFPFRMPLGFIYRSEVKKTVHTLADIIQKNKR